jgi:hemoglobin
MHSGNGEHPEMDERAQTCFAQALGDTGFPDCPLLGSTRKAYFRSEALVLLGAKPSSLDS